jgi:hypothetical protein
LNGHDTNPFLKLRDPRTGKVNPVLEKNIAAMIRAMGTKNVTEIARACKTADAPLSMTITGLPIK